MMEESAGLRIPVATYRLQFNRGFTFADAANIVPYLRMLGISDIYSSPYFRAREGSEHGYDIIDHNSLNPELGTEEDYERMTAALREAGAGQVLDIVPNHMCIESGDNVWWMDVLENGPDSLYAKFFDIDWEPVKKELRNKVLLPVLGDQYGIILENGELKLVFEGGAFFVYYYEHKFPVNPRTYIYILRHRIDVLKERTRERPADYLELMSIITSLSKLPQNAGKNRRARETRHHEKEGVKKRLASLVQAGPVIRTFIDENLAVFNGSRGRPRTFDHLDRLLSKQSFRLSFWRVATEEINYRRFFDINKLGSIRMEDPDVFRETNELIFRLVREGKVTGLRVDHPDGLYDPTRYFQVLQKNCYVARELGRPDVAGPGPKPVDGQMRDELAARFERLCSEKQSFRPFYIVGEKILLKGERMPDEWPIFSTTGYEFLNLVNGVFIDTRNAKAFDRIYEKFIRRKLALPEIVYWSKSLIMQGSMSSEINTLGHLLNNISEKDRHTRDFTLNSLIHVIREVIASFPVYRTYVNSFSVSDRDRQYIENAVSKAKRRNPAVNESIFTFLRDVLLLHFPGGFRESERTEWLDFVMKFQQVTGPVMAKGLEDTACYIYNRLVSLNEVGGYPERFGITLEAFHGQNMERSRHLPLAMITSSTHDTKRSEDVRARLNVLSEIPEEWRRQLFSWSRLNKKKKAVVDGQLVPDFNEEYLLYQTMTGVWPPGVQEGPELEAVRERIKGYMLKAMREAKVNTSWISPHTVYEDGVMLFIDALLKTTARNQFLKEFLSFQSRVAGFGIFNSLSQVLLKMTSPGVPDFYQGTELFDFSLVDPDNRRPVDYDLRFRMLQEMKEQEARAGLPGLVNEMMSHPRDGRIKLYIISKTLQFRGLHRDIFDGGEYIPLEVSGDRYDHVCAFARRMNGRDCIVAVPRFFAKMLKSPESWREADHLWSDNSLVIPYADPGAVYWNVFAGEQVAVREDYGSQSIPLSDIFSRCPVALLSRS